MRKFITLSSHPLGCAKSCPRNYVDIAITLTCVVTVSPYYTGGCGCDPGPTAPAPVTAPGLSGSFLVGGVNHSIYGTSTTTWSYYKPSKQYVGICVGWASGQSRSFTYDQGTESYGITQQQQDVLAPGTYTTPPKQPVAIGDVANCGGFDGCNVPVVNVYQLLRHTAYSFWEEWYTSDGERMRPRRTGTLRFYTDDIYSQCCRPSDLSIAPSCK